MPPQAPKEIFLEILLQLADPPTVARFALCSRDSADIARHTLYRRISVAPEGRSSLFATLASNSELSAFVNYLHIAEGRGILCSADFYTATAYMCNLKSLHIDCRIDIRGFIPAFRGSLRTFSYAEPLCDTLFQFLHQQSDITALSLTALSLGNLKDQHISPQFLPCLAELLASPRDIPYLVRGCPVRHIKMDCSRHGLKYRLTVPFNFVQTITMPLRQLELLASQLQVVDAIEIQGLLPDLEELVVMQDTTWGKKRPTKDWWYNLAVFIDAITFMQKLRTLIVVTQFSRNHMRAIRDLLVEDCGAPCLRKLIIHSKTTCLEWPDRCLDIATICTENLLADCAAEHFCVSL
ncbi:hypothetical protein B0H17DRAFT_1219050 [Mycena rosella]|uniref:Uncharacterized protein n=1 Tax=Mycena rosella TaxID=1033263 RepID=A0AAD7FJQ9_MYCRO|nr:hypothetical protein B0H17DRAFT_1219050 [Mycena rosella]